MVKVPAKEAFNWVKCPVVSGYFDGQISGPFPVLEIDAYTLFL